MVCCTEIVISIIVLCCINQIEDFEKYIEFSISKHTGNLLYCAVNISSIGKLYIKKDIPSEYLYAIINTYTK